VQFSAKEEFAAQVRLVELAANPISGRFDYDHMKAIHRHIFQDAYEWAGEERVGPAGFMNKEGHIYYPAGTSLTMSSQCRQSRSGQSFLNLFIDRLRRLFGRTSRTDLPQRSVPGERT